MEPLVSIITATYNRSNVLRYTIESVLHNTFQHWELLVVGDACTDDTAEVVASFGDQRISFYNLAENCGEQSGPNNAGIARSRGRYLAFLNHDDLWFLNHLDVLVSEIQATDADLVYSHGIAIASEGHNTLVGATPYGVFSPEISVPASFWLADRKLVEGLGGWRYFRECFRVPSQDLLYRVWKARKRIHPVRQITGLAIRSGQRPNSYRDRPHFENRYYWEKIKSGACFDEELSDLIFGMVDHLKVLSGRVHLKRAAKSMSYRLLLSLGWDPVSLQMLFSHGFRKGAFIDKLRAVRGLNPIPERTDG